MILRKKIEAIRKHLLSGRGAFVNNVIVTLPSSTKILNEAEDTVNPSDIMTTEPATIRLSSEFNSIGIIDGQHRVFSYYEGGVHEAKMQPLRKQQNLLATGIVFPKNMQPIERTRFEARLFLEINSNQTNAKSDLKQEIALILDPFSTDSICKRVVNKLNDEQGPLFDMFERYFFDQGKIKTTTVVSYGLRPLCGVRGSSSLYQIWDGAGKEKVQRGEGQKELEEYIDFCTAQINLFLKAVKSRIPSDRWTPDKRVPNHLLTTTIVNGIIFCLR